MKPDPNDPAAVADERRRRHEAHPTPDRQAAQEAERIETMQDNLRHDYGRDLDAEDIDRAATGEAGTASGIAKRNTDHGR